MASDEAYYVHEQCDTDIEAKDAEIAALNAWIAALTEALGLYGRHLDDGNGSRLSGK